MLDLNAIQITAIDIAHFDVATLLSFTNRILSRGQADATMQSKLGDIWTAYSQSANTYDLVYNPSRKDLLTDDLKELDKARDKADGAWHENILAAQRSPNETKARVARQLVQLYKDYHMDTGNEYMKQSENTSQMIQAIEGNAQIMAALPTMGLDEYLTDLKQKNEAFLAKMIERTDGTIGQIKGAVATARADVEQKYRNLMRMVNVVNSYEGNGVLDSFISAVNAEIEHYRQILARKGVSTGSNSGGGTTPSGNGQNTQTGDNSGNNGQQTGDNTGNTGQQTGDNTGNTGNDNPGGNNDNPGGDNNDTPPGGGDINDGGLDD